MESLGFSAPGTHLRVSAVCEASLPLAKNALHSPASKIALSTKSVYHTAHTMNTLSDRHRTQTDLCLLRRSSGGLLCHSFLDLSDLVSVVGMVRVVGLQEVELCVPGLVDSNTVLKLQPCQAHTHTHTL